MLKIIKLGADGVRLGCYGFTDYNTGQNVSVAYVADFKGYRVVPYSDAITIYNRDGSSR